MIEDAPFNRQLVNDLEEAPENIQVPFELEAPI